MTSPLHFLYTRLSTYTCDYREQGNGISTHPSHYSSTHLKVGLRYSYLHLQLHNRNIQTKNVVVATLDLSVITYTSNTHTLLQIHTSHTPCILHIYTTIYTSLYTLLHTHDYITTHALLHITHMPGATIALNST